MSGQNNQSYLHQVLQGLQATHAAWQGNSPNATPHSPVSEANSEEAAELLREAANQRVATLSATAEPYYDPRLRANAPQFADPRLRANAPQFADPRLRANAPVFVSSRNANAEIAAEAAAAGRNMNANNFTGLSRNINATRGQGGRRRRPRKSRKRSQKKRVHKSRRYRK
jgi:hypothetical protein